MGNLRPGWHWVFIRHKCCRPQHPTSGHQHICMNALCNAINANMNIYILNLQVKEDIAAELKTAQEGCAEVLKLVEARTSWEPADNAHLALWIVCVEARVLCFTCSTKDELHCGKFTALLMLWLEQFVSLHDYNNLCKAVGVLQILYFYNNHVR